MCFDRGECDLDSLGFLACEQHLSDALLDVWDCEDFGVVFIESSRVDRIVLVC